MPIPESAESQADGKGRSAYDAQSLPDGGPPGTADLVQETHAGLASHSDQLIMKCPLRQHSHKPWPSTYDVSSRVVTCCAAAGIIGRGLPARRYVGIRKRVGWQ